MCSELICIIFLDAVTSLYSGFHFRFQAKQRLGELITEMIAIEACAPEITSRQETESLSTVADAVSREEDEDAEEPSDHVYEEGKALKHQSVETEPSEQEHEDGPEKLRRSAENLVSHT